MSTHKGGTREERKKNTKKGSKLGTWSPIDAMLKRNCRSWISVVLRGWFVRRFRKLVIILEADRNRQEVAQKSFLWYFFRSSTYGMIVLYTYKIKVLLKISYLFTSNRYNIKLKNLNEVLS